MSQNRQILDDIAKSVQEIVNAETSVVALAESEEEIVYYAAAAGKHAAAIVDKRNTSANSGLCGVAFQGKVPVLVCQTAGDHRVRQDHAKAMAITTALAVPVIYEDKLLGALMALNRTDGSEFDEEAEKVLAGYAAEVSSIIFQFCVN